MNNRYFNPEHSTCCQGNKQPGAVHSHSCCSQRSFNPSKFAGKPGRTYCCGSGGVSQAFNSEEQVGPFSGSCERLAVVYRRALLCWLCLAAWCSFLRVCFLLSPSPFSFTFLSFSPPHLFLPAPHSSSGVFISWLFALLWPQPWSVSQSFLIFRSGVDRVMERRRNIRIFFRKHLLCRT